uniref:G-protein coupled receptors family 1 profile domain-containing protein n=1 Tax=Chelonoidis abingdonii TaxID=106734 RepID=A0A8C0G264_CHEAB
SPVSNNSVSFSAGLSVLLAALMGLLVVATVLGNALVILAFVVDRSLRTQGNFFFLNLALADLLVDVLNQEYTEPGPGGVGRC